jgi:hypothetical protein
MKRNRFTEEQIIRMLLEAEFISPRAGASSFVVDGWGDTLVRTRLSI